MPTRILTDSLKKQSTLNDRQTPSQWENILVAGAPGRVLFRMCTEARIFGRPGRVAENLVHNPGVLTYNRGFGLVIEFDCIRPLRTGILRKMATKHQPPRRTTKLAFLAPAGAG
ncbi:MAG: hypothetical protein AMJ75_06015 [Phycisphaerae bacterium SM1_79]|nr:MAG: hypothetical protein AMJ75_06015 [Phycisphaerae bacterium SM1_79]